VVENFSQITVSKYILQLFSLQTGHHHATLLREGTHIEYVSVEMQGNVMFCC
jgi:hypothetical protein